MKEKVAVLYHAGSPPASGHSKKPVELEEFKKSAADIAWSLSMKGVSVITPREYPADKQEADWVFPDTDVGIERAYDLGARVFWLNTILHEGHAIDKWLEVGAEFVGQTPQATSSGADKFETNKKLRASGLSVASSRLVTNVKESSEVFPVVVKPVSGRGSEGVSIVQSMDELNERIQEIESSGQYDSEFMLEEMLPGEEISVIVMPPGKYFIEGDSITREKFWSLPPILRFNHQNGIAPCDDDIMESKNSCALTSKDIERKNIRAILSECETAARIVGARAPIRVDCRQTDEGFYKIFDLNMNLNLAGPGRPGREDKKSLPLMAASEIGWSYADLLMAILSTRWHSL